MLPARVIAKVSEPSAAGRSGSSVRSHSSRLNSSKFCCMSYSTISRSVAFCGFFGASSLLPSILNSSKCLTIFVTFGTRLICGSGDILVDSLFPCLSWNDDLTLLNLFLHELVIVSSTLVFRIGMPSNFRLRIDDGASGFLLPRLNKPHRSTVCAGSPPLFCCCCCFFSDVSSMRNDGLGIFFRTSVLLRNCGFGGNAGGTLVVGETISGSDSMSS